MKLSSLHDFDDFIMISLNIYEYYMCICYFANITVSERFLSLGITVFIRLKFSSISKWYLYMTKCKVLQLLVITVSTKFHTDQLSLKVVDFCLFTAEYMYTFKERCIQSKKISKTQNKA